MNVILDALTVMKKHLLHKKTDIITKRQIDIIKSSFENIRDISVYGGEPLLPRTKEIISYILKEFSDYPITIITNGYYLDEFIEIFAGRNNLVFQITLDGTKEYHDKTRYRVCGGNNFDKIINNIEILLKNGNKTNIRMNLCNENLQYVQALINLFEDKFSRFKNSIIFTFDVITQIEEVDKQYIFMWLKRNLNVIDKVFEINVNFNRCNIFKALERRKPIELRTHHCSSETTSRIFDPYGKEYSCMMTVGREDEAIGYYSELDGININEKNGILSRNILSNEECKTCKISLLCGGGCAYERYDRNKTVHAPNCDNIKRILENFL